MDKKGAEATVMIIISLILIVFISVSCMIWIANKGSGASLKDDVKAKEAALLIDSAKPGTTIFISYPVSIDLNKRIVFYEGAIKQSNYSYFRTSKISYRLLDIGTEIIVS